MNLVLKFLLACSLITLIACEPSAEKSLKSYSGEALSRQELNDFLRSQMDSLQLPALSFALVNEGTIVYQTAIGLANLETQESISETPIFEAASLSKPVFAYWVMQMSEKGFIDLDRPLHFYLPDSDMERDPRYKRVTARMVLGHSTGFTNWRWFDPLPEDQDLQRGDFFMLENPGSAFTYSGEGYQYLARVIAHLNFMNLNELGMKFREEVALPLGMKHAYFIWDDVLHDHKVFGHAEGKARKRSWGSGLPHQNSLMLNAAGGLHTDAPSYAHFLLQLINKQGLYPETYEEMLEEHIELAPDHRYVNRDGLDGWALGFGRMPAGEDTLFVHGGSNSDFQSGFSISIKKKFGYVFFTNCDKGYDFNRRLLRFLGIRS